MLRGIKNKKWLYAGAVALAAVLFISLPFAADALELENDYPKIPLPDLPGGEVKFEGAYSLNDIAADTPPFDTIDSLSGLIYYFFVFSIVTVGIVAFGVIIYTGVMFMTSGARPQLRADAKKRLQNIIIGLALLLGSVILLNIINPELAIIKTPKADEALLSGASWPSLTAPATTGGRSRQAIALTATPEFPLPVRPGETVTVSWNFPSGSRECWTSSSPDEIISGWSKQRLVERTGSISFAAPQRRETHILTVECRSGDLAIGETQINVSSRSLQEEEQIREELATTIDLKLKVEGDEQNIVDNLSADRLEDAWGTLVIEVSPGADYCIASGHLARPVGGSERASRLPLDYPAAGGSYIAEYENVGTEQVNPGSYPYTITCYVRDEAFGDVWLGADTLTISSDRL